MKLHSLKLKSFLIHEDKSLSYTKGLNVVRGPNEAGKSSQAEAFGYLLVGSSALEKSLEDTVNYNAKSKSSLRVDGAFSHDGVEYTAYRSATGAEISTAGAEGKILCTGQKQVTQYIENLLGLPAGRAHHILFANQNEVRGVLAVGPTAASEFIEKLAGFSEIDALIKKAVDTLPNGNTEALETQISSADEALAALTVPEVPDHSKAIAEAAAERAVLLAGIKTAREVAAAQAARKAEVLRQRQTLTNDLGLINGQISSGTAALAELQTLLSEESSLRTQAGNLEQVFAAGKTLQVYREIAAVAHPEEVWEGSWEDLDAEIRDKSLALRTGEQLLTTAQANRSAKASQRVSSQVCPIGRGVCLQAGDPAEAARLNAAIDVELAEFDATIQGLSVSVVDLRAEIKTLEKLTAQQQALMTKAGAWPEHLVEWDTSTIPNRVSFKGAKPEEVDVVSAEAEYAAVQKKLGKIPPGGAQAVAVAEEKLRGLAVRKAELETALSKCIEDAPAEVDHLQQVPGWEQEAESLLLWSNDSLREQELAAQQRTSALAERERWESSKAVALEDLRVRRGNSEFIKALKEARLRVSEKLWGTVMGGVSNYFSRLRGRPSVVSRSANGFLIDGKAGRPSGSTLDILGLALRIVLAKVFANTGLLVIDEPSAGCDQERTANMAAVVMAAGFEQVIWIAHSDIAEIGSANLIEM